jgi:hypothetical protein
MTTVLPQPESLADPLTRAGRQRPPGARARSWVARHDGFVAFLAYLVVSLIWYRSVVAHMSSHCACGLAADPGDNADFIWWFEWFVRALGHGLPLLHTNVIWTPAGINLAGTTASLLMALVAAPLTLLWGPIPAYNVLMILAPVVSAWAADVLCRHITRAALPSLLAGATYGFSSFELAHLVGHPQMVLMVGPPLLALFVIRLLDGTLTRRRFTVYASVLLIAQVLLSVEVTFTMALAGALGLLVAWATGNREQRHSLLRELPFIVLPWIVAGVATCWYTLQVLRAPAYATQAVYLYPTDLLSFFVPMPYTWFGGAKLVGLSANFPGGWNETSAYLGWPLLLILAHYLVKARRTRPGQLLGILLALLVIWTLGPILWVNGHALFRLPFAAVAGLPLLNETLVGRTAEYVALVACVALAIWLARPHRWKPLAVVCGSLAVLALLPNLQSPSDHNVGTWIQPRFFATRLYTRYLRRGETILPIPWGAETESYMWQAEDHMYWNQASGYWLFRPPASWLDQLTKDLWLNHPSVGDGPLLRTMARQRDITDVVVLDGYVAQWQSTLRDAGLRVTAATGGVTVYRVPRSRLSEQAKPVVVAGKPRPPGSTYD